MKLDTEFCKLPLRFDAARLAEEIAQFTETDWRPHPQGHPGNSAVPLIAVGGDPLNDSVKGAMLPTPHLARCPYLCQVLAMFGTVLGRTRLMRIAKAAEATPHVDTNYYWMQRVRIHVPIITFPEVRFVCNEREVHMAAGETWIFNTWRRHNVINPTAEDRIHLVADSVGSAAFWDYVTQSERPFSEKKQAFMTSRLIEFQPNLKVELEYESVNYPVVMTPWEQSWMVAAFFEDVFEVEDIEDGLIAKLETALARFQRHWRSLWSQFGESERGWPAYQQTLDKLDAGLAPFESRLRLVNGMEAIEILRQGIIRPALNPELAQAPPAIVEKRQSQSAGEPISESASAQSTAALEVVQTSNPSTPGRQEQSADSVSSTRNIPFDRPIIIVAAPRSGSTMLFETLARSPDVWTIGGESHAVFEQIAKLQPAQRDFHSNRLEAQDADAATIAELHSTFLQQLRDRDGNGLADTGRPIRMLEKTPKNGLRIPFLNAVFPDALFIYLYREPRDNVSSMLDAWRSKKFVTYPQLPDWPGEPWSLALIPGWQELRGKSLAEITAIQWSTVNACILDDLSELPPERWCLVNYEQFLQDPQQESRRLCDFAGVGWDQQLHGQEALPLSRHTLTPPNPEKWRANAEELQVALPLTEAVARRLQEAIATKSTLAAKQSSHASDSSTNSPVTKDATSASTGSRTAQLASHSNQTQDKKMVEPPPSDNTAPDQSPLRSVHTTTLPQLLAQIRSSLLISTYQAGRVVICRVDNGTLNTHFCGFHSPMGMACDGRRLAIGTRLQVWELHNQRDVAQKLEPAGRHDACFLPRSSHVTGDIQIHEIAYGVDDLWIVNTRFSCLCTLDGENSFVPRWRPPFVSGLAPEDRCHLNGMAMVDGRPKYVTALGETDSPGGWRENKAFGGCLLDVESGEIIARGLSMPHSPRWYQDQLWVLESGDGSLATVDMQTGRLNVVARLPGFTRGLDFYGPYAFIGLSQVRESAVFSGIPITEREEERTCGATIVDIRNGNIVAFLRFDDAVQEVFAVQLLLGISFPDLRNERDNADDILSNSWVLPEEAMAEVQIRAAT